MKRATGYVPTITGLTLAALLLLTAFVFFFGRQYVRPVLPQIWGEKFFPPLPTRVESEGWQLLTPPVLPETPSSILRTARQWASDRDWELSPCTRLSAGFPVSSPSHRVYDDPDYATCLRYLFPRSVDNNTKLAIPGQWLPGRLRGEQARRDFEAILEKRHDFFYAAYLLGCWHRQNGDAELATQYFEKAYATAPVVLVMSFDLIELGESWEQSRPSVVTLVNHRTFAHNIDLTYHYGVDDCATVRYPLLQADINGLVLIPAEVEWLTWERMLPTGLCVIEQLNRKFDTSWRFRGQSKVSLLQHVELTTRPYDTNPVRTDPFFDPFWGTQQSLGIYERMASYCESQNEPSLLYDRQILSPQSHDRPTHWEHGRIVQGSRLSPKVGVSFGETDLPSNAGFVRTKTDTIRPIGGARVVLIDSCDPRLLTWYLQQSGMTRNTLIAKMRTWHAEHTDDDEITLPQDRGHVLLVVDRDSSAWLVKLVPVWPASYTATTLRIGSLPW